ncbi:hypothetical protein [Sulfurimonas sp. HSL3-7]|uniref:hypothetical protein n=1 Tax=Sulfonitrofixus jiaomeiensis TaxID=3131938 RepID=UPI0031F96990
MCLIIAFIAIVYAVSAFSAGNTTPGFIALAVALFFTALMIRNILQVKKMKDKKGEEN